MCKRCVHRYAICDVGRIAYRMSSGRDMVAVVNSESLDD